MPTPEREIADLREQINRHDYLYYVEGKPEVSDREYDRLFARLKELEAAHPDLAAPDSPTQRVGGAPLEGFAHVAHAVLMLSIDNTYNEAEVREFDARVAKGLAGEHYEYIVDPKIDGVSASLRYERGLLVLGATRGDGRTGDDVTANIKTIRAIPLRLRGKSWPGVLEVRGEVYWPREAFDAFNAQREKEGLELFANPRNATAGTLKQLDSKVVAGRGLAFMAHGFGEIVASAPRGRRESREDAPLFAKGTEFETAADLFAALKRWGIPTNQHTRICKTIDEVISFIEKWETQRHGLGYETDGLVVKINNLAQRETLGATSRYPRWCIAYKYAAEQAESILRSVDFQVGKLGTITPRAVMDPMQLSGTTVRHASLHNFDQVGRLDVRIGDTVVVEKAGEIIPQVIRVVMEKRPKDARKIAPPKKCPVCGGEVAKDEGGVYIRCINPACDAQIKERLRYFCGRDQMDVEGAGEVLVEQLVDSGLVHQYADLYALKDRRDELVALERMGEKSADNLLAGIEQSKKQPLARVLAALNIRHVGSATAELLAEHFGSMEAIAEAAAAPSPSQGEGRGEGARSAQRKTAGCGRPEIRRDDESAVLIPETSAQKNTTDPLQEVEGVGPEVSASIREFFGSDAGRKTWQALRDAGVNMKQPKAARAGDQPLAGKIIVVTGTLENWGRNEVERLIKDLGGKPVGSVSRKTDFVLAGADPGSKVAKARDLHVKVIDEKEFLRLIGRGG